MRSARGDRDGVRRAAFAGYAHRAGHAGAVGAACCCSATTRSSALYTADAAVAALAATLLLYAAAFQFPDGVQVLSAGALRGLQGHARADAAGGAGVLGHRHAAGRRARASGLGWGPQGMWIGLIVGLTVAALLLGRRFLRSSRAASRMPMRWSHAMAHRSP